MEIGRMLKKKRGPITVFFYLHRIDILSEWGIINSDDI